jgi:hypothetical protein
MHVVKQTTDGMISLLTIKTEKTRRQAAHVPVKGIAFCLTRSILRAGGRSHAYVAASCLLLRVEGCNLHTRRVRVDFAN